MEFHNTGAFEPVQEHGVRRLSNDNGAGNDRPRTALMLGLMGEGKSSVGNLLLTTQVFPVAAGQAGGTKHCHIETGPAFDGRELRLVDLPGVNETRPAVQLPKVSPQGLAGPAQAPPETTFWSALSEAFRCLGSIPGDGIDAILLVMRCSSRVTEESYLFWETLLTDNFGPKVWSRVILVLTFVDQLGAPPRASDGSPRSLAEFLEEGEAVENLHQESSEFKGTSKKLKHGSDSIRLIQQEILHGAEENPSFGKLLRRANARCVGVNASSCSAGKQSQQSLLSESLDDRSYFSATLLNQIRAVRAMHNSQPYTLKDFQKAQEQLWTQRMGQAHLFQAVPVSGASTAALPTNHTQHRRQSSLAKLHAESQTRREGYERAMKQLAQMAQREDHLLHSLQQQATNEIDSGRLPPPSRPPPRPPSHASRVLLLPSNTAPPGTLPTAEEQELFQLQQAPRVADSYPDVTIHRPIPVRPAGAKLTYTWAEAGWPNTTLPHRPTSQVVSSTPSEAAVASVPVVASSPSSKKQKKEKQKKEKKSKKPKDKKSSRHKSEQIQPQSQPSPPGSASPQLQQNGAKKNGMGSPKARTKRTTIFSITKGFQALRG